jgi:hypothetical protein
MKVVNIERVIISAEELATLEKAKDILETMSLCGCAVSDDAIEIAESIDCVIDNVLVCDDDDTGAFISFHEGEVVAYDFDFEIEGEGTETETE